MENPQGNVEVLSWLVVWNIFKYFFYLSIYWEDLGTRIPFDEYIFQDG